MEHYTLIGHPLGHSMSPWIHERLFALAGRKADYTLTDLVAEDLTLQIDDLRAMQGFNITIPHKMEIIPFLDDGGIGTAVSVCELCCESPWKPDWL